MPNYATKPNSVTGSGVGGGKPREVGPLEAQRRRREAEEAEAVPSDPIGRHMHQKAKRAQSIADALGEAAEGEHPGSSSA